MDKEELKRKYIIKIKEYLKHNKLYYQDSAPKISDAKFDLLKMRF